MIDEMPYVARQLALDVLTLAAVYGMPDTFWLTDQRIDRACQARDWAFGQIDLHGPTGMEPR